MVPPTDPDVASRAHDGLTRRRVGDIDVLVRPGAGTARPLVLLHGIGSRSFSFAPLMQALDSTRTVIAWDAPGYGDSRPLVTATPVATDYASAVLALLDALALTQVDLLGHSLGTLIAAHVAATTPQRVGRLALLSPTLGYGIAPGEALPPAVAVRPAELAELGGQSFAARRGARLVHDPDRKQDATRAVIAAMATMTLPGYAQAAHLLGSGRLLDDVARLACPTLVAVGAEDVVTPPDIARRVAAALPRQTAVAPDAVLFAGCGHALYLEEPAAVAARLDRHFSEERI
ncbi:alpha/beta hydrolase [Bradyrhizobium sp. U87765 SZCCT0131]|uniref:alpha/beta fold hydrolase n=1 Tax=unclassified Bradyrhizobium TaxID=2631580 RepID=UPI001BA6180C|nr:MULTISPECIES: alpha/beta hydrolase [unclassified Bradyrhizobium]MBR1218804.1 alpha/beta hydrolase [Bradyrhizobium sp. U87765 SZCCT0131]MBR1261455.1 alpha/beta hydrolase [Bradyrhizobium sp. U87765 SZCCT0134]MBR1306692.1 alpha/beta hydrolase [Bradyrhizobium sp. U87765 SZCCT0110]MBR1317237.1 alpha/beta hydrolase [Bradyrhizobium sp. U87765 SZCCT0109]MBR1350939.1 alpha/beta hydrolase [Bradyrhizobium sp. U87765 SZCCT0048]